VFEDNKAPALRLDTVDTRAVTNMCFCFRIRVSTVTCVHGTTERKQERERERARERNGVVRHRLSPGKRRAFLLSRLGEHGASIADLMMFLLSVSLMARD
jgi:hypothetical protein